MPNLEVAMSDDLRKRLRSRGREHTGKSSLCVTDDPGANYDRFHITSNLAGLVNTFRKTRKIPRRVTPLSRLGGKGLACMRSIGRTGCKTPASRVAPTKVSGR